MKDDLGEPVNDIVALVKPRKDWWEEGPLSSPLADTSKTDKDDPFDAFVLGLPLPAYGCLGISALLAISCVAAVSQVLADLGAEVPSEPLTWAILVGTAPSWIFFFVAAIKKGQAEADAEDRGDY